MIVYKKVFDVEKDILPFVEQYSLSLEGCYHEPKPLLLPEAVEPTSPNQESAAGVNNATTTTSSVHKKNKSKKGQERPKIRIVGQEQDGAVLYSWDAKVPMPGTSTVQKVTHIGLYDPAKKTNELIFVHEKLVDVINCTVSQERTFIGFVTHELVHISETVGRKQKQDVYHAYLAEVASPSLASRVFYLNLERSQLITLQFLYGQYRGHVSRRESHLIVLLHKESIGLYHMPVARVGNDGVIMSGEPKKDQIFEKRFIWSQWDSQYQRLFVAHMKRSKSTQSIGSSAEPNCLLTCYQFTEDTVNELMIDIPFDLPTPLGKTNLVKTHYLPHGPYQTTPDLAINIQLLTQNNGSLCLCVQHPYVSSQASKGTHSPAYGSERSETLPIQYYVHMIHHGKTLKCHGPTVHRSIARKLRLFFSWMGDYVMVHAPGYFTHLLNAAIEFQPCHHILWHEQQLSGINVLSGSSESTPATPHLMLPFISERHGGSSIATTSMIHLESQIAYKVTLEPECLLDLFKSTVNSTTRTAILHFAIVHKKDLQFVKKIFDAVKNDVVSAEILGLMEEYLVGSTYSSLKKMLDPPMYKYIPFTCAPVFRGQTEMAHSGERLSSISYASLRSVTFGNLSKYRSSHGVYDTWHNLYDFITQEPAHSRFSSLKVQNKMAQKTDEDESFVTLSATQPPSVLQRLTTIAKSAFTPIVTVDRAVENYQRSESRSLSRSENYLGAAPSFLNDSSRTLEPADEELVATTLELLTHHLKNYLKRESRIKIKNIASEYVACQIHQSRQLVHLLCTILLREDISTVSLEKRPGKDEHCLYLLLERYNLASLQQAFPHPPGFDLFFSSLAVRCLRNRFFIQYVEYGALRISSELCLRIMEELPSNDQNVDLILLLLGKLNPEEGLVCARRWNHPISKRFLARHYTNACLTDGPKEEFSPLYEEFKLGGAGADSTDNSEADFPPLSTLLSLMEKKSWRYGRRQKSSSDIDAQLITDVCLEEFYASGGTEEDILTFG